MGRFKDLTGQKFGRLTVIERVENSKAGEVRWKCRCECGVQKNVLGHSLTSGLTKSCGCLAKEKAAVQGQKKLNNLTGLKFGSLRVLERAENKGKLTRWKCRCDCGKEIVVYGSALISGLSKTCGCSHKKANIKHGMKNHKLYKTWAGIKQRCLNPNEKAYKNYGGRGIKICDEWKDNFQAFYDYVSKLEHYGEKGYTLDRINNNGNYEPNNLRWADRKMQARNTRKNNIVEYNGEMILLKKAAELSGIDFGTLWARMKRGDIGDRLFRPVERK